MKTNINTIKSSEERDGIMEGELLSYKAYKGDLPPMWAWFSPSLLSTGYVILLEFIINRVWTSQLPLLNWINSRYRRGFSQHPIVSRKGLSS